jgi:glutamate/tyrosine decarboxylase-like PLP-dependent enzyme
MAPGGSFGNFIAIHLARFHAFPEVKKKGIQHLPPLKVMVSEVAHYSIKKGVNLAGLGTDCLVNVKTDKTGRMCP